MKKLRKLFCDCVRMPGLHPADEDDCEGSGNLTTSPAHWALAQAAMALIDAGDGEVSIEVRCGPEGASIMIETTLEKELEARRGA
jgi:hypothetical protein